MKKNPEIKHNLQYANQCCLVKGGGTSSTPLRLTVIQSGVEGYSIDFFCFQP